MKATHRGQCQLCGRLMKIIEHHDTREDRRQLMSTHGYEVVEYIGYEGECPGSRERPYEHSSDLIAAAARLAEEQMRDLNNQSDVAAALRDPKAVWRSVTPFGGGAYLWTQDEILPTKDGRYVGRWETNEPYDQIGLRARIGHGKSMNEAMEKLNGVYADHLRRIAEQRQVYAKWLRRREADWRLTPLTPIAVLDEAMKGAK